MAFSSWAIPFLLPASAFPQAVPAYAAADTVIPAVRPTNGIPSGSRASRKTFDVNFATVVRNISQSGGGDGGAAGFPQSAAVTNPALLASPDAQAHDTQPNQGTGGAAYLSLMPQLNLPDFYLADLYASLPLGGMEIGLRYLAFEFGTTALDSAAGSGDYDFSGREYSLTLAKSFPARAFLASSFGLAAKVVAAPEEFSRRGFPGQGYLFDLGYTGAYRSIRVAAAAVNLGYPVSGIRNEIRYATVSGTTTVSHTTATDDAWLLTPPSFQFALGWSPTLDTPRLHILEAGLQAGVALEFQREGWQGRQVYPAASINLRLFNVFAPGLTWAEEGDASLTRLALGLYLFNHVYLEFRYDESASPLFDGQKTFRLEIRNPMRWGKRDLAWWYR